MVLGRWFFGVRLAAFGACVAGCGGGDGADSTGCEPGSIAECYSGPDGTKGVGACVSGAKTCKADGSGYGPCQDEVTPSEETCATPEDDDCDGEANEDGADCTCEPGETAACYSGPSGTENIGACIGGMGVCSAGGTGFEKCTGEVVPTTEDCDNLLDDDCDGSACSAPLWGALYGDAKDQQIYDVAVSTTGEVIGAGTLQGTLVIGGATLTQGPLATRAFLARWSQRGAPMWAKSFDCTSIKSVAVDADGAIAIAGGCGDYGMIGTTEGNGMFAAKLGPDGNVLWARMFGDYASDPKIAVAFDDSGDVLVAGSTSMTINLGGAALVSKGGNDVFVGKLAGASGAEVWSKIFGTAANQDALGLAASGTTAIVVGSFDGSFDLGGGTIDNAGTSDAFIVKLDTAGNHLWSKRFGGTGKTVAESVSTDAKGAIVLGGTFESMVDFGGGPLASRGPQDLFVAKLDTSGAHVWSANYGGAAPASLSSVAVDDAANVLVTGLFSGTIDFGGKPMTAPAATNAFLAKLDESGSFVWSKRFGDSGDTLGYAVAAGPESVVFVGTAYNKLDFGLGPLTSAGAADLAIAAFAP